MSTFLTWLASSPLAEFLKVFFAVAFGAMVKTFLTGSALNFDQWQSWVIAGLSAAAPLLINALNPADARYGFGGSASTSDATPTDVPTSY